jgi:hypothetical protein
MASKSEKHLSTTALARQMGKESKELFILLASSGWIVKVDGVWQLTEKGRFEGGIYASHPKYGEYIAWPELVQQHPLFALLPEAPLTATNLGYKLEQQARLVNLLLAERGWIKKHLRGWLLTPRGKSLGGQQHESDQSGIPYVTWPETLLDNKALRDGVAQVRGEQPVTLDGRRLVSRAERMINNWLYLTGVVHACGYNLQLPDTSVQADFFLPELQAVIEYWGGETPPAALAGKLDKQGVYQRYGIPVVEVGDEDLSQLDEVLARALMRLGHAVY